MLLFGKRQASPDCAARLTEMASENAIIDVDQVEASGRIAGSGKSRLRAFDASKNTVTIDVPTKAGRPLAVGLEDTLHVFAQFQNALYKFRATVREKSVFNLAGVSTPSLVLDAPEKLENGNRRRHFRVMPLNSAPATVEWRLASVDRKVANRRPWNKGAVHDISGRGIAIHFNPKLLEVPVSTGQQIELKLNLSLPQGPTGLSTRAIIRRTVDSPDGIRDALWGIEFEVDSRDSDAALEQVVAYVTHCQIEAARLKREREI